MRRPFSQRGFTLVEMLVSFFILSVTVLFVVIVVQVIKTARDSAYENLAFHIAENKLDALRALGYSNLPAAGTFSDAGLANLPSGAASTSITTWNSKTKEVSAGVSWLGSSGTTKMVQLSTLVTEVGGL